MYNYGIINIVRKMFFVNEIGIYIIMILYIYNRIVMNELLKIILRTYY